MDYIFHPHGISMIYHNFAQLHFFAWLPLQAVIGAAVAFNVVVLAMFALVGYTVFLLARDVIEDAWAGFVAGVIHAFWPYAQSHFDQLLQNCYLVSYDALSPETPASGGEMARSDWAHIGRDVDGSHALAAPYR